MLNGQEIEVQKILSGGPQLVTIVKNVGTIHSPSVSANAALSPRLCLHLGDMIAEPGEDSRPHCKLLVPRNYSLCLLLSVCPFQVG